MDNEERYSRNMLLKEIGQEGQRRLCGSSVLVVGCGGTGTSCAEMLVRGGIGSVKLIDPDTIDGTNLQRQALFTERDIGKSKAETAARELASINSEVCITGFVGRVDADNAETLVREADLVMDCTDDMGARFLINDACVKAGKPWVYSGAVATYGMVAPFVPGGACFRCVFPLVPKKVDKCASVGVLNGLPGIIGRMASIEAIRILTKSEPKPFLVAYDAWQQTFERIALAKRAGCECCDKENFEFLERAKGTSPK